MHPIEQSYIHTCIEKDKHLQKCTEIAITRSMCIEINKGQITNPNVRVFANILVSVTVTNNAVS